MCSVCFQRTSMLARARLHLSLSWWRLRFLGMTCSPHKQRARVARWTSSMCCQSLMERGKLRPHSRHTWDVPPQSQSARRSIVSGCGGGLGGTETASWRRSTSATMSAAYLAGQNSKERSGKRSLISASVCNSPAQQRSSVKCSAPRLPHSCRGCRLLQKGSRLQASPRV